MIIETKNKVSNHNFHKQNIIILAPTMSQPRFHKRAIQLSSISRIQIFAFNRGLYEESNFPKKFEVHQLGQISDRNYFKRSLKLIKAIFIVKQALRGSKNPIFYAFSIDCAIIAKLSGINTGFLEVGDLILPEGLGVFAKTLEKILIQYVRGVFLTSKAYYSEYYKKVFKNPFDKNKFHFVENKLSKYFLGKRPGFINEYNYPINIGVIGLLRYEKPLRMLIDFVGKYPEKYILSCFGDGPLKDLIISAQKDNIIYHGSFSNPVDLENIYRQIDLSYVVYDNSLKNVRLAIPNKLYESAFFGIPLICAKHTYLEEKVLGWGIGRGITMEDDLKFEFEMLDYLQKDNLSEAASNCRKLSENELIENDIPMLKSIIMDGNS